MIVRVLMRTPVLDCPNQIRCPLPTSLCGCCNGPVSHLAQRDFDCACLRGPSPPAVTTKTCILMYQEIPSTVPKKGRSNLNGSYQARSKSNALPRKGRRRSLLHTYSIDCYSRINDMFFRQAYSEHRALVLLQEYGARHPQSQRLHFPGL